MANRKGVISGGGSADGPVDLTPAAQRGRTKSGTSSLSNGSGAFASGTLTLSLSWTPAGVHITAHEGNTLGTVQSWSSSSATVTLNKPAGGTLGTVGFTYSAME